MRKLAIKNLTNDTQKIKYKLPVTKFFFMKYPELMKLSPGMCQYIDVSFRPIKQVRRCAFSLFAFSFVLCLHGGSSLFFLA